MHPSFNCLIFIFFLPTFYLHGFQIEYATKGVDKLFEREGVPHVLPLDDGSHLILSDYITTGPSAFAQIKKGAITMRFGKDSIGQWIDSKHWKIHDGSVLFCLEEKESITVSSTKGSADVYGACTFIAEATSNGGYKFICLSGKPVITTGAGKSKVPAGRLVLVLGETNTLGNAYDIDLLLLLKSSLLINAFEEPPPTMKKIGLAIYSQQLRMGGKYDALIGDATSDKNLQMWVLGKKGSDNKPSK
jgi:hypothetical protein